MEHESQKEYKMAKKNLVDNLESEKSLLFILYLYMFISSEIPLSNKNEDIFLICMKTHHQRSWENEGGKVKTL